MNKRALFAKAAATTALTVSLVGIAAGTASAMPIEGPLCREMAQAYQSGMELAESSFAAGDYYNGIQDYRMAIQAQRNYNRHCLGTST